MTAVLPQLTPFSFCCESLICCLLGLTLSLNTLLCLTEPIVPENLSDFFPPQDRPGALHMETPGSGETVPTVTVQQWGHPPGWDHGESPIG